MFLARVARTLTVTAVTAAVVAGGSLPATAAPVAAHGGYESASVGSQVVVRVILGELECISTEDFGAAGDEVYIKVNGKTVWTAQDSVDEGGKLAVNIKANVGDTVSLHDDDWPDADDLLGSDAITANRGTLVFQNDGANYVLDFRPA